MTRDEIITKEGVTHKMHSRYVRFIEDGTVDFEAQQDWGTVTYVALYKDLKWWQRIIYRLTCGRFYNPLIWHGSIGNEDSDE